MSDRDLSDALLDAIAGARADRIAVAIAGSGSKAFLARVPDVEPQGRLLSTVEHCGIIDYRPDELVVRVRCGTPIRSLQQALAKEGQMLAFEPPEFRGLGTIGGAVASGLAGPGRPWRGGVRDALLGVVMINGLGQRLVFGGQVMKNVAGFDVSRLQAGAFGAFGLLLEVSLRVLPVPAFEETRLLEVDFAEALGLMRRWARTPLPVSATSLENGQLRIRLSGAEPAVLTAGKLLGGEVLRDADYWSRVRDHKLDFFRQGNIVGVRQLAPATPLDAADGLVEWSGARRWRHVDAASSVAGLIPFDAGYAHTLCHQAGGDPLLGSYQRKLKAAFDPDNLFNPEICHADVTA